MKRKTLILCATTIISAPATYYAALSTIYYSWLSAAEPERWPTEKAALWAGSALVLTVIFLILLVYSVVSLMKIAVKHSNEKEQKT